MQKSEVNISSSRSLYTYMHVYTGTYCIYSSVQFSCFISVDTMARTKGRKACSHAGLTVAATERIARKRASILKAARILSSQEMATQQLEEPCACTPSDSSGSETEPEGDTFSRPEPEQLIKLSAQACGSGGRFQWRGRLRGGGGDIFLEYSWVRTNFKA